MIIMKKMINLLSDIGIALIITTIVSVYILQAIGMKPYIVQSGSMEPAILTGSLCFVDTKYAYDYISKGDVIAYDINGKMITHRVIKITSEGFVTKGDNNELNDGISTTKGNYVGRNILALPYLGYLLAFIQTSRGKIICITLFVAMIIVNIILSEISMEEKNTDSAKKSSV